MASKIDNDEGSSSTTAQQLSDSVVIDTSSSDDHHGIPKAIFFEDIPAIAQRHSAPALIDKLSALSQKYRFFEERLVKGKNSLEEKIAEAKRAIAAVSAIQKRFASTSTVKSSSSSSSNTNNNTEEETTSTLDQKNVTKTHFELSDGLYVSAIIPPTDKVCLWLGANVMVEFSHDEALTLLNNNLSTTEKSYQQTSDDIVFLRDQLNTTDVNLSRVYNHHVKTVRSSSTPGMAASATNAQPQSVKS